jgi:hypothetical protein
MGKIPESLQKLLLKDFDISSSPIDPSLKGLTLRCGHGEARFVVSRQQLLDIAQACLTAAEAMPRPT